MDAGVSLEDLAVIAGEAEVVVFDGPLGSLHRFVEVALICCFPLDFQPGRESLIVKTRLF